MSDTTVPPAFLQHLDGIADPLASRMMAMIVALGGEVFVLKAELERTRRALAMAEERLEAVRRDPDFVAWLAQEERDFARHLIDPIARAAAVARPGRAGAAP
jgi:hypothetical protein